MEQPGSSTISVKAAKSAAAAGVAQSAQSRTLSVPQKTSVGHPLPLGPSQEGSTINFAIFSHAATSVALCLLDESRQPIAEYALDTATNKTGDVWHIAVDGLPAQGVLYGYKLAGPGKRFKPNTVMLDPYAPLVEGRKEFGKRDAIEDFRPTVGSQFYGTYDFDLKPFDWGEGYKRPNLPFQDLIIYEMTVRCFTADASSGLPDGVRGTFKGVLEKVPYLKKLGVTAVELLPVFEYDELEFQRRPNPRDHMVNVWGYSHLSFVAPMARFAADGGGPKAAAREFKELVQAFHAEGIEVILDVVYNHTVEGDDHDPYVISFRGIDPETYYMIDQAQSTPLLNLSGCGNTVSGNHPVVKQLIIDSLVRWVEEYHVDGFRFDLASCLCRDEQGRPLAVPPLIRDIAQHPVLSKVKLIAEPWDLGMYQVGSFPNWDVWAEWNGMYRDAVRKFIKGDTGMKKAFATRMSGSSDLYAVNQRKPYHSINFVNAHDGFSLADLVSYNMKHNDANGESNRDGSNDNFSWNCGAEGVSSDAGVLALRQRQQRNFMMTLMLALGTPMIVMGDESQSTHQGNNNFYGHDNHLSHMKWDFDEDAKAMYRFTSELIAFRKSHPSLGRDRFLQASDVVWHENNWDNDDSRFLAFTLLDTSGSSAGDIYVAFNAHTYAVAATLPSPPQGQKWTRVVDTNLPAPKDITPGGNSGVESVYSVQGFSSIMLLAQPAA
ncbi:MAG: hypothetical protein WDW36_002345 [Sanguina aurantia]